MNLLLFCALVKLTASTKEEGIPEREQEKCIATHIVNDAHWPGMCIKPD